MPDLGAARTEQVGGAQDQQVGGSVAELEGGNADHQPPEVPVQNWADADADGLVNLRAGGRGVTDGVEDRHGRRDPVPPHISHLWPALAYATTRSLFHWDLYL